VGVKKKTIKLQTFNNGGNADYLEFEKEVMDKIQLMEDKIAKLANFLKNHLTAS
jgi:hypothetical protein